MDTLAILIPCYNEEQTISDVVRDFRGIWPWAKIYVYDNNSTDDTVGYAQAAGAIVKFCKEQGKGNVIRQMFREIDAHCYVLVDGDNTYPAKASKQMVELVLKEQKDMVIGDRLSSTYFTQNKRPFHNIGNSLVRRCINSIYQSEIQDVMTGYRAMSYKFVKSFPVLSQGFEIETEMTMHALFYHLAIANVVVDYQDRPEGSKSKLDTYSDGFRVLFTIGKLFKNYRPIRFFGIWAGVFTFVFAITFIPIFISFLQTGVVLRLPTLLFSGLSLVCALFAVYTGLILETISKQMRYDMEWKLQNIQKWEFDPRG